MTIQAEIDRSNRILVVGVPMDMRLTAKAIPGCLARWDKTGTRDKFIGWHFPLAWSSCVALRKAFGRDLKLGPKLTEWAWNERRTSEALEQLRSGETADLPRVRAEAPALWEAMQNRPFQITGAAFIAKGKRVCLGDEPRLGKTYQTLAAIIETGSKRILIACPKTATRSVWAAKIKEFTGEDAYVAQEGRSDRLSVIASFFAEDGPERRWLVINKEMIQVKRRYRCLNKDGFHMARKPGQTTKAHMSMVKPAWLPESGVWCEVHQWESRRKPGSKYGCQAAHDHQRVYHPVYKELFQHQYDAVVLDECHHALASTKNVQSDNITQIRYGAVHLPMTEDALKIGLSGTPFRSQLSKSWGVLNWLRPDVFTSYWRYAERHFGAVLGNGTIIREPSDKPTDPEAFLEDMRPYYFARTKAEVAPQLPPVDYIELELPMDGKQGDAYDQMVEDAQVELDGVTINANGILAEITRRKQLACSYGRVEGDRSFFPTGPSNKLDWVLDFLAEREKLDGKVVIATQFTRLANFFAEQIRAKGWSVVMITGESSSKQRDHAQEEFQHGRTRVAVINMFAGGEAIDLSAADEMILLDEPWTDDTLQQVENRIQSLAKANQLTVYKLRSEGTIEPWIASLTAEQREILMSAKPKPKAKQLIEEALTK